MPRVSQADFEETPVTRLFGCKLRSCLKARGAKQSITQELFHALPLDISGPKILSLDDALVGFMSTESLDWEMGASKQYKFEQLPGVLIVQLKRFAFSATGGGKISKHIHFPDRLTIPASTTLDLRGFCFCSTKQIFPKVCWDLMLPEGRERGATNSLAWWSTTVRSSQVVTTPLPLSETIYGITWMTQPLPLRPFQRCYENKPICSFILTKTPHRAPKITILLLGLQVNEAPAPTVSSPTPATACPEQPVRMMCCWPRQTIL